MSNICDFCMKIAGREEAVLELCDRLSWRGQYQNNGLGRVDEFVELTPPTATNVPGIVSVEAEGTCAWSIKTAMRDTAQVSGAEGVSLDTESDRLHLAVEAYSSEPGFQFQEHLLLIDGEVRIDDCIDYFEIYAEDRAPEEIMEELQRVGYTSEIMPPVNESGDICIGGYGESFGDFSDLDSLFQELAKLQPKTPLNKMIQEAADRRNQKNDTTDQTIEKRPFLE